MSKKKKKVIEEEEDFDALIAEASVGTTSCGRIGCKKSILLQSLICSYCRLAFCSSHIQAEIHGCSEAAKSTAQRAMKSKQQQPKNVPEHHRNHMKKMLQKTINDKADTRKHSQQSKKT